jgi:inosine/xanthosine triphosphate pyrophosphatase family protein
MKYQLVSALREEGTPVALDGQKVGKAYPFIEPRDVLVLRTTRPTSSEDVRLIAQSLHQSLKMPVLIVDSSIEVLVLRVVPGTITRFVRHHALALLAGIAALWFTTRAKFALRSPKA